MGCSVAPWLTRSSFLQIGIALKIQQSTMAETDQQIVDKVHAAFDTAVGILNDKDGWKVEKEKDGATIKSKKNAEGRKVWLLEVVTPVPASKLQDTDNISSWNTTLTESRVLRHIGDVKLSFQMTAEGGAGLVSARDFVYGSKSEVKDCLHIMGGCSVTLADQPEVSGRVRAMHGPGCHAVQAEGDGSRFTWLMDCDYRGLIPGSVIELAMPAAQLQMVDAIMGLA